MEMTCKNVYILWTGGWDSTYRMVELSMQPVIIHPIYIEDPGRNSKVYELKAMKEITDLLRKKKMTKAQIMPLIKISLSEIPENQEISNAYKILKNEVDMGSQHDWLARLAISYPMIELCIEKTLGDHAPIKTAIEKMGKLTYVDGRYVLDQTNSSQVLNLVLGNVSLPIFDKTEIDMVKNIKTWGYEDIMSHIWFCHAPINGKPCGLCNPCTTKMTSQMEFLLPKSAQKRNIHMRKIEKRFGTRAAFIYKMITRKLACLEKKNK